MEWREATFVNAGAMLEFFESFGGLAIEKHIVYVESLWRVFYCITEHQEAKWESMKKEASNGRA